MDLKSSVREYWENNPNAAAIGAEFPRHSRQFYETVEIHRYKTEPCLIEMAEFDRWRKKLVLEVGCGMGTDLRQFARAGANVIGVDLTWEGVRMAKTAFELFGLDGVFVVADAELLPFRSDVFDLVYSNGVIHHTPDTAAAADEIHRVVRPEGEARVMVYHRNSYFARVFVGFVVHPLIRLLVRLFPSGRLPQSVHEFLPPMIRNLYTICIERGCSDELILALCTDPSRPGPGNANPLARVYTRSELRNLFSRFGSAQTFVRKLDQFRFLPQFAYRWIERRFGWFLFIRASK